MNKSKGYTLLWMLSLSVMVGTTLVVTVGEVIIGEKWMLPNHVVKLCWLADILALFGFAYGMLKKAEEKLNKSKLFTMLWVVCLSVMVVTVLGLTVGEVILKAIAGEEAIVPDGIVNFCGLADILALLGFSYAMLKKVEERKMERYDELYNNRF